MANAPKNVVQLKGKVAQEICGQLGVPVEEMTAVMYQWWNDQEQVSIETNNSQGFAVALLQHFHDGGIRLTRTKGNTTVRYNMDAEQKVTVEGDRTQFPLDGDLVVALASKSGAVLALAAMNPDVKRRRTPPPAAQP